MNADGTNVKRLTSPGFDDWSLVWSPDGTQILFNSSRNGNRDIWLINSDGSKMHNLTQHPSHDWWPVWSPDASKIVFHSDRDGGFERISLEPIDFLLIATFLSLCFLLRAAYRLYEARHPSVELRTVPSGVRITIVAVSGHGVILLLLSVNLNPLLVLIIVFLFARVLRQIALNIHRHFCLYVYGSGCSSYLGPESLQYEQLYFEARHEFNLSILID